MWSFLSLQTGLSNGIPFLLPFLKTSGSPHVLQKMLGTNGLPWSPSLTPIAMCRLHKVSNFCLTFRMNNNTAYITAPVTINFTLVIHSYRNTNLKLKTEKINHNSGCCWHSTLYIKIILSWDKLRHFWVCGY